MYVQHEGLIYIYCHKMLKHNNFSQHPSSHINTRKKSPVMKTLSTYSLNFIIKQCYHTAALTIIMLYITSLTTYLSYNWKFIPLDQTTVLQRLYHNQIKVITMSSMFYHQFKSVCFSQFKVFM